MSRAYRFTLQQFLPFDTQHLRNLKHPLCVSQTSPMVTTDVATIHVSLKLTGPTFGNLSVPPGVNQRYKTLETFINFMNCSQEENVPLKLPLLADKDGALNLQLPVVFN